MGLLTDTDGLGYPKRTLPLIFLIETAGYMHGTRIGLLNTLIEEALPNIACRSDNEANLIIKIAVLKYSTEAKWVTPTLTPVKDYIWSNLEAEGLSNLGAACLKLNDKLSRKEFFCNYSYPPVIFLICGADPTDDYLRGINILEQNKWFQKSLRIAFAVGNDIDYKMLEDFTDKSKAVLKKLTPNEIIKVVDYYIGTLDGETPFEQDSLFKLLVGSSNNGNSTLLDQEDYDDW